MNLKRKVEEKKPYLSIPPEAELPVESEAEEPVEEVPFTPVEEPSAEEWLPDDVKHYIQLTARMYHCLHLELQKYGYTKEEALEIMKCIG